MDANVLFSAAITPEGVARAIFELALQYERSVSLVVTEHVLREALANMERKYPGP